MTPEEALATALRQQSDTSAARAEGTEYWFPVSLAELASGTIAALPPGSALVTTETLAEALRMPGPNLCGYPFFASPERYAAAIMEALRQSEGE